MIRTRPYHEFSMPSDDEICRRAEEMGIKHKISLDLARDVINVISHINNGSSAENALLPPSSWLGLNINEKELLYHKRVQSFLVEAQNLIRKASGEDYLTKAINFLAMLSSLKPESSGGASNGMLPIFFNNNVTDIVRQMEEISESVRHFGDLEMQMLELDTENSPEQNIYILSQRQELEIARIAHILKKNIRFSLPVTKVFVPNPSGTKTARTQMSEYSQLAKLSPISQMVMPDFEYKLVRKSLTVKIRGDYKHKQQYIYMLIDHSTSMTFGCRWKKALAVLLNRLEEAQRGNALLYVSLFDDRITQEFKVESSSEAIELFRKFRRYSPSGKSTMIDKAIKEVVSRIVNNGKKEVEIVLITDGDDVSTLKLHELCGVKLHYISIEHSPNQNLSKIATDSGGIFLHI